MDEVGSTGVFVSVLSSTPSVMLTMGEGCRVRQRVPGAAVRAVGHCRRE